MKRKIYFIIVVFFSMLLIACTEDIPHYCTQTNIVNNYEIDYIFLNAGEVYEFNIEEKFALSGIDISDFKIRTSNNTAIEIDKNKIIGKTSGIANLGIAIYEGSSNTEYITSLAKVFVSDSDNMIEIRTAEDLANIELHKSGITF